MAATDIARLTTLAINKMLKKKVEPITRRSYLVGEMTRRNRVSFGNGGLKMEWRPRVRRREITWGPGNPNTVSFNVTNVNTVLTLDYKTAWMGEAVREIEVLALQDSETAYFKKLDDITTQCSDDFNARFGPSLYYDGTGTNKLDGLESCGGVHNSTDTLTGVPVGEPSDTYAGKSTALGASGDWSAPTGHSWPEVNDPDACDYEYHALSPLIVDYNSVYLIQDGSTEDNNWDDCWVYACRYGTTYMGMLYGKKPDVIMLEAELLRRAKNSLKKDQQFQLDSTAKDLDPGIEVLSFDGIKFATEFGIPSGCGYGLSFDTLELRCMGNQLVKTMDDTEIRTGDRQYRFSFHGNLVIDSPAYVMYLKGLTSEGS
jgi:hypothetical protein